MAQYGFEPAGDITMLTTRTDHPILQHRGPVDRGARTFPSGAGYGGDVATKSSGSRSKKGSDEYSEAIVSLMDMLSAASSFTRLSLKEVVHCSPPLQDLWEVMPPCPNRWW